jgi:hypothetical protein
MSEPPVDPTMVLVTRGPEGVTTTSYAPVEAPIRDPYVRRRWMGDGAGGEVITEYAAAPERPSSYPAWLPFVPARAVVTTESSPGGMSPGARWPCAARAAADAVLAALVGASERDGWTAAPSLRLPGADGVVSERVFVREAQARVLLVAEAGVPAIVQLIDVPRAMLQERAV